MKQKLDLFHELIKSGELWLSVPLFIKFYKQSLGFSFVYYFSTPQKNQM